MTVQEVFDEIVDKLNIPARKRVTKKQTIESIKKSNRLEFNSSNGLCSKRSGRARKKIKINKKTN